MQIKLSIITVNLNNAEGLRKTIGSVVNQTYINYEYLVIDGGSIDGSVDIIKQYADKIDYWVSEPDNGIYNAMNKGIVRASGDYLLFLNSGDLLFDNKIIQEVANLIRVNQGYYIYYGNILAQDERTSFIHGRELSSNDFKLGVLPDHQATFIRRNLFNELGLYNVKYKIYADYDFMLKCFINQRKFYYIDKLVSVYQLGGYSANDYSFLILIYKYFGLIPFLKVKYIEKLKRGFKTIKVLAIRILKKIAQIKYLTHSQKY